MQLLFNLCVPFLISPEIETHFSWWEREGVKERVWRLIMKEAIQIIQMLALPPSYPPPRQWRVYSVPREWCQHGPLKTAAVRSEMNALAEHNGPNLNTTRIYARSEPQQKKEGYSAPIQPCCYFIRVVNLLQSFIPFVVFKCLWSLKHVDGPTGVAPILDWITFLLVDNSTPWLCLCLTADLHGLGQPLPCQVRTQASDQGPTNRRHRRSAAGWDHTGRR